MSTGTTAPEVNIAPAGAPAPRSSDGNRIVDNRVVAPDQPIGQHPGPAPRSVDVRCPTCGR